MQSGKLFAVALVGLGLLMLGDLIIKAHQAKVIPWQSAIVDTGSKCQALVYSAPPASPAPTTTCEVEKNEQLN